MQYYINLQYNTIMKMNSYLASHEIKDIKNYCQNRCIKIVTEHLDNKARLHYYRGNYKGYLYCIKVCNELLKKNINIKRYSLYNQLKTQQQKANYECRLDADFKKGLVSCFYDLMNFVSIK